VERAAISKTHANSGIKSHCGKYGRNCVLSPPNGVWLETARPFLVLQPIMLIPSFIKSPDWLASF
jgi:hypothetical protein